MDNSFILGSLNLYSYFYLNSVISKMFIKNEEMILFYCSFYRKKKNVQVKEIKFFYIEVQYLNSEKQV